MTFIINGAKCFDSSYAWQSPKGACCQARTVDLPNTFGLLHPMLPGSWARSASSLPHQEQKGERQDVRSSQYMSCKKRGCLCCTAFSNPLQQLRGAKLSPPTLGLAAFREHQCYGRRGRTICTRSFLRVGGIQRFSPWKEACERAKDEAARSKHRVVGAVSDSGVKPRPEAPGPAELPASFTAKGCWASVPLAS